MSKLTEEEIEMYKKSWDTLQKIVEKVGLEKISPSRQRMITRIKTIAEKHKIEEWRLSGFFSDLGQVITKMFGDNIDHSKAYFFKDDIPYAICEKWSIDKEVMKDIFEFEVTL